MKSPQDAPRNGVRAASDDPLYQVVVARYGARVGTRSEIYLNHHLYGRDDAPLAMDYFVWVIRNATTTIVVDTGFSTEGGRTRGRDQLVDPPQLFASLGIRAEDAPLVAVTHGHYDHIGNLSHFSRSTIAISRAEVEFVTGPYVSRRQFHHSFEDDEIAALLAARAEGRLVEFEDELELAPGVRMFRVGGHTPGQSMITVPTSVGTVLLASDALHYQEELDLDMPFSSVAELLQMYAGFDRIREMRRSGLVDHVVTGHDPGTMAALAPIASRATEFTVEVGEL